MFKAKEMFLNFLKWREDFRVDQIPKVNNIIYIIFFSRKQDAWFY